MSRITRRAFTALGASTLLAPAARADPGLPRPPLYGKPTARKRFVVWGSYTCPYTAQLFEILIRIQRDMPDQFNVEWRHFPTHRVDPILHVTALGFEGSHFWRFSFNMLMLVLKANGSYADLTPDKLAEFARQEGGSEETLKAAWADKAKWQAVQQDLLAGRLMGVSATPGLFFNGYFLTPDGIPLDLAGFEKSLRAMVRS